MKRFAIIVMVLLLCFFVYKQCFYKFITNEVIYNELGSDTTKFDTSHNENFAVIKNFNVSNIKIDSSINIETELKVEKADLILNDTIMESGQVYNDDAQQVIKQVSKLEIPSFLKKYPVKNTPLWDTVNIRNCNFNDTLTQDQKTFLNLNKLSGNKNVEFFINHRLNLSNSFYSLVISYSFNPGELHTVLVNYNAYHEIVAYQQIGYDNLSDNNNNISSFFRTNKVFEVVGKGVDPTVKDSSKQISWVYYYRINPDGKIINIPND